MWFNFSRIQFEVFSQRVDEMVKLRPEETFFESGTPLFVTEGVKIVARDRLLEVDEANRYLF